MQFRYITLTTLSIIFFAYVCTKPLNIRMLKIECVSYNSSVANITCSISNYSANAANVDCFLASPLNDILLYITIWRKLNGNFIRTPVNLTMNACQYLGKREKVPFQGNLIMKWVQSFSNINHTCPYSGHIFIKKMKTDQLRMIVPDGEYRMDVKVFDKSFSNPIVFIQGFGSKK